MLTLFLTFRDIDIRHSCERADNLQSYGWLGHDGRNWG